MLTKIVADQGVIGALQDQPTIGSTALKGKFDENPDKIIDYINNTLTEELDAALPAGLTVGRALISNANGYTAVSDVTATELGYLDGVTSALQTQLNSKQKTITSGTADPSGGADGDIYLKILE